MTELTPESIKFGVILTYSDEWYRRSFKEKPDKTPLFLATGKVKEHPTGHYLISVIREGTQYAQTYHISFLAKAHRPDRVCPGWQGEECWYDKKLKRYVVTGWDSYETCPTCKGTGINPVSDEDK